MDYLADLHKLIRRDNVPFWNEPRERRDGFVSFRCFLLLGGGWERTLRGGKRTERMGAGLGEDGNGNRRMGEDFERRKEESERTETGL